MSTKMVSTLSGMLCRNQSNKEVSTMTISQLDEMDTICRTAPWVSADILIERLIEEGFTLSEMDKAAIQWARP